LKHLFGLLLISGALALAQPQPATYAIKFIVTSGRGASGPELAGGGTPLRGANVRITGPGIRAVEYPEVGAVQAITGRGVSLNDSGTITTYLRPGHYKGEFSHPTHHSFSAWFQVPAPGLESFSEGEIRIELAMRDEIARRSLTVAVDAESNASLVPLVNARVRIYMDGSMLQGVPTDSNGIATFKTFGMGKDEYGRDRMRETLVPGDLVRIEASADGYETRETTFVIGSAQEGRPDPRRTTLTTATDFVSLVLRKPRQAEQAQPVSMIVEVVNGETRAPIQGAKVDVDLLEGRWSEGGTTIETGRTLRLDLEPFTPGKVYKYQVKVFAPGFEPKWSDVPPELITPGQTRLYVVHLTPVKTTDILTSEERAALARVAAWANSRTNREFLFHNDTGVRVKWRDMKSGSDGPPYYDGHVSVAFMAPKPGDPPPGPIPVGSAQVRIMVGSVPAVRDPTNYRLLYWHQGRFFVSLSQFSAWLIRPTDQELMALASEVAGLIGGGPR
jgi:hypothetical protein